MENKILSEKMMNFGLTRQETVVYFCLFTHYKMTGYEVAKISGISRSNAYSALAGLVDKGAAYTVEETSIKYIAVDIKEFCDNRIRNLVEDKEYLVENLPDKAENIEGYITINGTKNIYDKIRNMLETAKERVYLSVPCEELSVLKESLHKLLNRNIKLVIISDSMIPFEGAQMYVGEHIEEQIRVITDSKYVLVGEIGKNESSCLYSGQKNFVRVFKDYLRNEIKLIEYKEENK